MPAGCVLAVQSLKLLAFAAPRMPPANRSHFDSTCRSMRPANRSARESREIANERAL